REREVAPHVLVEPFLDVEIGELVDRGRPREMRLLPRRLEPRRKLRPGERRQAEHRDTAALVDVGAGLVDGCLQVRVLGIELALRGGEVLARRGALLAFGDEAVDDTL